MSMVVTVSSKFLQVFFDLPSLPRVNSELSRLWKLPWQGWQDSVFRPWQKVSPTLFSGLVTCSWQSQVLPSPARQSSPHFFVLLSPPSAWPLVASWPSSPAFGTSRCPWIIWPVFICHLELPQCVLSCQCLNVPYHHQDAVQASLGGWLSPLHYTLRRTCLDLWTSVETSIKAPPSGLSLRAELQGRAYLIIHSKVQLCWVFLLWEIAEKLTYLQPAQFPFKFFYLWPRRCFGTLQLTICCLHPQSLQWSFLYTGWLMTTWVRSKDWGLRAPVKKFSELGT